MEFKPFEIIKNRPDKTLLVRNCLCPFCGSKNIEHTTKGTTLLGIRSMNHEFYGKKCSDCGNTFEINKKGTNIWYVDKNNHVIKGVPSCYERYTYDCICGGKITRKYLDLAGNETHTLVTSYDCGVPIKQYKTYFECDKCEASIESEFDYWQPNLS